MARPNEELVPTHIRSGSGRPGALVRIMGSLLFVGAIALLIGGVADRAFGDHTSGADEITISNAGNSTADVGGTVSVALAITTSTNPHKSIQWEIAYNDNLSFVSATYDCENPAGINYPEEVHVDPSESAYTPGFKNLGNFAFCESLSVPFNGATFTGTFVTVVLECDALGAASVFIRPKNDGGNPANDPTYGTTLKDFTGSDITTTLENSISVPGFGTQAGVPVTCAHPVDLGISKSAPAAANTGGTGTYSLTVNNPDASSRQATIDDAAPAGVTFTSVNNGGCTLSAANVNCANLTLPTGNTTIDIGVTFVTCGEKDNTATVTLIDPAPVSVQDPVAGNNSSTAMTNVDCPVLSVTKVSDVATAPGGTNVVYTITVSNDAGSTAPDVLLTDPLGGATKASGSDADCTGTTTVTCGPRSIAGGANSIFTIVALMPEAPQVITNTAEATATGADPASSNTVNVTVTSIKSDIFVTKTENIDPVEVGGRFSYTIRARNNGPVPAKGLWVMDVLPDPSESPSRGDVTLVGASVGIDLDGNGIPETTGLACTPGATGPVANPNPPPATYNRPVICSVTPTLLAALPVNGSAFITIVAENHAAAGVINLNGAQAKIDGTYGEGDPTIDTTPTNAGDCAAFTSIADNWGCEATLSTVPTADALIGQFALNSAGGCNTGLPVATASTLCSPWGVAIDPAGNVYVADSNNHRVLQYDDPLHTDSIADRVYGQADFASRLCNRGGAPAANTLCNPNGLAIDNLGNLLVADANNRRVVRYNAPLLDTTADAVFGQGGSFTTNACNGAGLNADSLCDPTDVAVDGLGNVYVADGGNNRVLQYNPLSDTTADRVYGQLGSFTTGACNAGGIGAATFCSSRGITVDQSGDLYVSDDSNGRVLHYDDPLGAATPDRVYGQPNFVSSGCAVSAVRLCFPYGLDIDPLGGLYVADFANSRIAHYYPPLTDTTADHALGQTTLTGGACNMGTSISATTICLARSLAVDGAANIFVADTGNHRVLMFDGSRTCSGDFDCDGAPDTGDLDDDNDGDNDAIDNCQFVYNGAQNNTDAAALDNGPLAPANDVSILNGDAPGDACDPDDDNDGILDATEATGAGCGGTATLRVDIDTDGDHLTDGWECANGSNPTDAGSKFVGSGSTDADGDRITDIWEQRGYNASGTNTDSDADGCHDMVEAASIDGNTSIGDPDRLSVARRALNIWMPNVNQDYALDIDKNGVVGDPDRLFVARAALLVDWLPKSCS